MRKYREGIKKRMKEGGREREGKKWGEKRGRGKEVEREGGRERFCNLHMAILPPCCLPYFYICQCKNLALISKEIRDSLFWSHV